MSRFGFCGPSYESQSTTGDNQLLINLYGEIIESGRGVTNLSLHHTPGTLTFAQLPEGPIRAEYTIPYSFPSVDRCFAIGGSRLCEVFADGTVTDYGDVIDDGYQAYMAFNGQQLAIASGGRLFIFDIATNTLTGPIQDSNSDLITTAQVRFVDGYFLSFSPLTPQQVNYSAPFDGTSWDPLDFFSAETDPDRVLAILIDHRDIWVFGDSSVQVFVTSTDPENPFQVKAFLEQGCGAPDSPVKQNNAVYWLGKDPERGGYVYWKATGYSPERVSNHPLEDEWRDYANTPASVNAVILSRHFAFTDGGHQIIQLNFVDAGRTWRYDTALPPELGWYQVAGWDDETGQFTAHRATTHTSAFGKHLIGDRSRTGSGIIAEMSSSLLSDDGLRIHRIRQAPHVQSEQSLFFARSFQLLLQTGKSTDQTLDPQVMMQYSKDGGETWSKERWKSAGKIGQFKRRAVWRGLGRMRDLIIRVTMTDNYPWHLIDGYIKTSKGVE